MDANKLVTRLGSRRFVVPAGTIVEIVLPWPYKGLSPNARLMPLPLSRVKARYKKDCKVLALAVRNGQNIEYPLRAPVSARIVFSAGPKGDLPDEDNAIASFKAGMDAIVDSKLIADDNPENLHSEIVVTRGARREVRVTLVGAP